MLWRRIPFKQKGAHVLRGFTLMHALTIDCTLPPCCDFLCFLSACAHDRSLQSCPTLCDPMDCNLPGSSVHGILQARMLEWVAMPSSRGDLPNPGIEPMSPVSPALEADSLPLNHQRSPFKGLTGIQLLNSHLLTLLPTAVLLIARTTEALLEHSSS